MGFPGAAVQIGDGEILAASGDVAEIEGVVEIGDRRCLIGAHLVGQLLPVAPGGAVICAAVPVEITGRALNSHVHRVAIAGQRSWRQGGTNTP